MLSRLSSRHSVLTALQRTRRILYGQQQQQQQQQVRFHGCIGRFLVDDDFRNGTSSTSSSSFFCRRKSRSFHHHPVWTNTSITQTRYLASTAVPDSSSSSSSSSSFRLKVAIVGSGPSACYTAKYLQAALEKLQQQQQQSPSLQLSSSLQIDLFERLPTPYGLVRYGVAPDHPEVKNVQNDWDELFAVKDNGDKSNGINSRVRFLGNVSVGQAISVDELRQWYHAVVLAYGCESDRTLKFLEQRHFDNVLSARQFVAWYNGHPDYYCDTDTDTVENGADSSTKKSFIGQRVARALHVDTTVNDDSVRKANVLVIGQGNVALDCARILVKGGKHLYDTDIASYVLPILGNGVANVFVVGRRGHVQGAFTIKELRELTKLQQEGYETAFHVRADELDMGLTEASQQELDGPSGRPRKRIHKLLTEVANSHNTVNSLKHLNLRFLLNPVGVQVNKDDPSVITGVILERTKLEGEAGCQTAKGTGEFETIPADLVLLSIGYKGVALPGIEEYFDDARGVVCHEQGKVDSPNECKGGLYVSGWLKRGPTGIIGTNITDAKDTVATILEDLQHLQQRFLPKDDVIALLEQRGVQVVKWEEYQNINNVEKTSKRSTDQPRNKLVGLDTQLKAAFSGRR